MEPTEKFTNSKDVIAFLAESFPNCFSVEGDAKPLKIGIFQDLATRLENEERVSKTLLRSTLRHYTNSWRYLHSVKEGVFRVDLDGNNDAQIEKEHADHAQQQLEESKAKAAEKRKAQQKESRKHDKRPPRRSQKPGAEGQKKFTSSGTKSNSQRQNRVPPAKLTDADLKNGTKVTVKLGKSPMPAIITEVAKDGVHVQLDTGMVVKVAPETLRLARSKRS